jgi:hypothetical protein
MAVKQRSQVSERVQKHRDALRAAGFRPVQIWVPDVRRPGFAAECQRQSLLLQGDPTEAETLQWIEAATDTAGWS